MEDRGGESQPIGKWGKAEVDRFFVAWHAFKDGKLSRLELQLEIVPIRARMARLLSRGSDCGQSGRDKTIHAKTAKTCQNILSILPAFFTCCYHEGVEPTNNSAEQALRHPVQWRKSSFGSQSDAGSRFVERILSTVETCRRQGRNTLDFLTKSVTALISGTPPPSLLPHPTG
jgi:transposase